MSKLEDFAKEQFGITLTEYQLKLIEAYTENKVFLHARQSGLTTANKILRAYIKDAL